MNAHNAVILEEVQQLIKGRMITANEFREYIILLEEYGLERNALMMIINYCVALKGDKVSQGYILKVAKDFAAEGITTAKQVEQKLLCNNKSKKNFKNILTAPFVIEMCKTTANMYRLGWDERNGGNISYMLEEKEVAEYLDLNKVIRYIPLMGVNAADFDVTPIIGKIFIVTGTGKYFKNVQDDPENNLGIVRISKDGKGVDLLWGFKDGGRPTSEFPAHLMSHMARLKVDPENRVVMHSHPTNTLAMNFVHELDEKKFTHTLWEMCTECIVVFPDGVGILPWMLCGTDEIGKATAKKMEEFRLVVWAMHGIYGAGKTMDETFGLIETVEKAAQIYMLTAHLPRVNTIKDEEMLQLVELFKVNYRKDFLNINKE